MPNFVDPPEHGVEVMIDLETMGTSPYSPIIAIGAVRFEAGPMQAMPPFYQAITLESCLEVGLRIQADTVLWWMKQSAQAKQVFEDPDAVKLPLALDAFTEWWGSRPDYPWGNSAAFDLGLLKDAYKACGLEPPWAFYRERCYRTLKSLPAMDRFKLQRSGTHHNALDDAISQAHHCREMLMWMKTAPLADAAPAPVPAPGTVAELPLDPESIPPVNALADDYKDVPVGAALQQALDEPLQTPPEPDDAQAWRDMPG